MASSRGIKMSLAIILVAMLLREAAAQSRCTNALTSLAPCLNFITGNSSTPSSSCCSQLASVVQGSPQCLCAVLNGGASLGITINQTLAMSLPNACKVQTPPLSQCNAGGSNNTPATSPVGSPTGSPADSSDEVPDADTPSALDIPSGDGSKTVPSTDGNSSDGSILKAPLQFSLFIMFILSVSASIVTV